jgi:hypothetical protein
LRTGRSLKKPSLVIEPQDPLARFFHQRNHFSPQKKLVHRKAFIPSKELTTSVFHIVGMPQDEVAEAGTEFVKEGHGTPCYGWARFLAAAVDPVGLRIDYNNVPPRHADLIGWPKEKEEQISIAQELAARSTLVEMPLISA